jgi:hypothetical protein
MKDNLILISLVLCGCLPDPVVKPTENVPIIDTTVTKLNTIALSVKLTDTLLDENTPSDVVKKALNPAVVLLPPVKDLGEFQEIKEDILKGGNKLSEKLIDTNKIDLNAAKNAVIEQKKSDRNDAILVKISNAATYTGSGIVAVTVVIQMLGFAHRGVNLANVFIGFMLLGLGYFIAVLPVELIVLAFIITFGITIFSYRLGLKTTPPEQE